MRRFLLSFLALAAVLAAPALPAGSVDGGTIQPGNSVSTSIGGCTLNFVFRDVGGDAPRTYIGTAAHCVAAVGDRVEDWGRVVWRGEVASPCDFALLAIDAEDVARVNPAVRRWGGPTGIADRDAAALGDPLAIYGYGLGYGATEATRARVGVLRLTNERIYASYTPAIFGDSGGPVLRLDTGEAFGVIDTIGPYASTMAGAHMENVMARLARDGFDVELVTAPFVGAVPLAR